MELARLQSIRGVFFLYFLWALSVLYLFPVCRSSDEHTDSNVFQEKVKLLWEKRAVIILPPKTNVSRYREKGREWRRKTLLQRKFLEKFMHCWRKKRTRERCDRSQLFILTHAFFRRSVFSREVLTNRVSILQSWRIEVCYLGYQSVKNTSVMSLIKGHHLWWTPTIWDTSAFSRPTSNSVKEKISEIDRKSVV